MQAADDKTYNGWKNYETWAVGLWLGNDEGMYNLTREMAQAAYNDAEESPGVTAGTWTVEEARRFTLADALMEFVEGECLPDLEASLASDLLGAAVSEVDWHELADNLLSEIGGEK